MGTDSCDAATDDVARWSSAQAPPSLSPTPSAELPPVGPRGLRRPAHLGAPAAEPHRASSRILPRRPATGWLVLAVAAAAVAWAGAVVLALGELAADSGWWDIGTLAPRSGAAAATWFGLQLLARRIGLPGAVVAGYTGVALALAVAFPAGWALSAASVAAASTYGLLAVVTTRATRGLWTLREAVMAAFVSTVGAVVVSGYDVTLHGSRFAALVLVLTLLAGLALASQLARPAGPMTRLGVAAVVVGTLVLLVAVGVVQGVVDVGQGVGSSSSQDWWSATLHLGPLTLRPLVTFVGMPALMWGAAHRWASAHGWWPAAFGVLGTAAIATSLLPRAVDPGASLAATGWSLGMGLVIGVVLVGGWHVVVRRRLDPHPKPAGSRRSRPPAAERSRVAPLL